MIEKILSRKSLFVSFLVYLTIKSIPFFRQFSLATYFITVYAIVYFIYNRLLKRIDLLFPGCFFSYGMILISIISVIVNGCDNIKNVLIEMIPICINYLVIFPSFIDDDMHKIKDILKVIIVHIYFTGIIISFLNIFHYIYNIMYLNSIFDYSFNRMFGVLGNPNEVGWFEAIFLGSIIYIKNNKYFNIKLIKNVFIIAMSVCVICLIFSQCRSVYLSLIVFIFFNLLTIKKYNVLFVKNVKKTIFILCMFALFFAVLLLLYRGKFSNNRLICYQYAMYQYLNNNKVFGLGIEKIRNVWIRDYYSYFSNVDKDLPINQIFSTANAHNIILQQLCTNGIFGAIVIVIFIIRLIYAIYQYLLNINQYIDNIKIYNILFYYVILGLVIGMVDNAILFGMTSYVNFMFLIAAGFILKRI